MLHFLPPTLRGVFAGLLVVINTLVHAVPLLVIALTKALIPIQGFRNLCGRLLNAIVSGWISINSAIFRFCTPMTLEAIGFENLKSDVSCLITSNHQSWADIVIMQGLLNHKVPQMKFFLKKELILVPVLGLCWWALDFPFMKRYSRDYLEKHPEKRGADLETTRKACEKFRHLPVSICNFAEGTRFTSSKHRYQDSPFQQLLKPKAGGMGFVLGAMDGNIKTLLDITIVYKHTVPDFWDFLCGRCDSVKVILETITIPEALTSGDYQNDENYRRTMQRWINELWQSKDRKITELKATGW